MGSMVHGRGYFWQERVVRCHVDLDRAIASGWPMLTVTRA